MTRWRFLLVLGLIGVIAPALNMNLNAVWERDFINFWLAPRAWWAGIDPYDTESYKVFGLNLFSAANPRQFNFTYPPHALFLFAPFSLFPSAVAFAIWNLASLALFYFSVRPFVPKGIPPFAALFTPAVLVNLNYGQTGIVSAALFLLAFRGSGLAAAALTIKPHLGFLVAPALLKNSRILAVAIGTTLISILGSALVFGGWSNFFDHALNFQGRTLAEGTEFAWMFIATTPFVGYGLVGWAVYGAAGLFLLLRNFSVFTAATATFLISPYGLHYDMAAVCVGFAILLYTHWSHLPLWQKAVASLGYLTPVIVDWGTWLIPPILLLGLLVQTEWSEGLRLTLRLEPKRCLPRFAVSRVNAANIRST